MLPILTQAVPNKVGDGGENLGLDWPALVQHFAQPQQGTILREGQEKRTVSNTGSALTSTRVDVLESIGFTGNRVGTAYFSILLSQF